jgi:tRNA(adenine34) deaminase
MSDLEIMNIAFEEAKIAFERGEYPVGAVLMENNRVISKAGNRCNLDLDPTAHAEILVIREAYKKLNGKSLKHCTLYTTLFPCPMCEKTIVEVGIPRVVFGATTFKWIREHKYINLVPTITGPIMEEECRTLFEQRLEENGRDDILSYERQGRR